MTPSLDATTATAARRRQLLALLQEGDLDAALQVGLMDYRATAGDEDAPLREAQARLRTAWDARERYRAREARLARRAAERTARRSTPPRPAGDAASAADTPAAAVVPARPALPAAAAAALARARARAAGKAPE